MPSIIVSTRVNISVIGHHKFSHQTLATGAVYVRPHPVSSQSQHNSNEWFIRGPPYHGIFKSGGLMRGGKSTSILTYHLKWLKWIETFRIVRLNRHACLGHARCSYTLYTFQSHFYRRRHVYPRKLWRPPQRFLSLLLSSSERSSRLSVTVCFVVIFGHFIGRWSPIHSSKVYTSQYFPDACRFSGNGIGIRSDRGG